MGHSFRQRAMFAQGFAMPNKALTILLADQQHLSRLYIEKMLNQLGYYRIVPVQTFEEVLILTALPAEPFDVLIFNAGLVAGEVAVAAFQQQHPQIPHVLVYDDQALNAPASAMQSLVVRLPGTPDSVNLEHFMDIIDRRRQACGCCRGCGAVAQHPLIPIRRDALGAGQAMAALKPGDLRHVGFAQGQLQGLEVALQVGALGRRGNNRITRLHGPGQGDLCRGGLVASGDLLDHWVFQDFAVGQGHVRSDMDTLGRGEIHHGAVLQVGVQFDLVGGDILRPHGADRLFHQVDGEVGNADLSGQAQTLGFQ